MPVQKLLESLGEGLSVAAIGWIGWCAYYLYNISKGENFRLTMLLINLFLSFFIGWLIGEFIPDDFSYKYGIVWVGWFCAIEIIRIIEKKIPTLFSQYIDKWLPK